MTTEGLLDTARQLLATWVSTATQPAPNRLDVKLAATDLLAASDALHSARWGYLSAITGLDDMKANEIEALYHFCEGAAIVTLRVRLPRDNAVVPSICGITAGATFFERELAEMFGVTVTGAPNSDRLFLPDEWPTDKPPLRKDFIVPVPVEN